MLIDQQITIREATQQEDSLIAKHFYHMWQDLGVPDDGINPNWLEITLEFIEQGRRDFFYKAFVAEIDGGIVGSASCQLFTGLFPNVFLPQYRQDGYIWGVYVEPSHRKRGIAKQLTSMTINHLKAVGCKRIRLNASPAGQLVYESLGFHNGNAMLLDLVDISSLES